MAAPRTGRIGHCLKKVAAAEPGFPEVPWGFSGNPPSGWSSPLPWFLLGISGGFDFWALLGCVWPACPMCIRHSVGLEHSCSLPRWGPGRSREARTPVFSMARVSTQFLLRPPYTRLWDRIPRVLWDTLADESISPRQTDGELLVLMCLRHGTAEEGRQLGGEPALRFAQLLELLGIPVDQADQVVPTDYFNGLVASAAGSPQPLSAGDLADLWDSLWLLLMAAADGKLSENFSPLENEWDRQDQLRWFSRDDPPPLQQPELLKWRHWRPGKIREMEPRLSEHWNSICAGNGRNGSLPTSPPLRSTLHTCRTSWGRTSARKHWTSWGIAGSGRSGNTA